MTSPRKDPDLDDLAEVGRRKEAARARALTAEQAEHRSAEERRVARHQWSSLRGSVSRVRFVAVVPLCIVVVVGAVFVHWSVAAGLGVLVPILAELHIRRLVHRERAWVAALPFPLADWPEALGWRSFRIVELLVRFDGKVPSTEQIRDALSAGPYRINGVSIDGNHMKVVVENPSGSKFDNQRRWLRSWVHWSIDNVFRRVHATHPIGAMGCNPAKAGEWH